MKKIIVTSLLFFFALMMNNAVAEGVIRFDFQNYVGEGGYAFYRVDIDMQNLNGELCFFDTGIVNVSDDVSKQLSNGVIWSRLLDLEKVKHACFKIELYKPYGWFFSPPVKYGDVEYRFFFVGDIKGKKMDGKLYEFSYFHPEYEKFPFRNAEEIKVSATGVVIRKK